VPGYALHRCRHASTLILIDARQLGPYEDFKAEFDKLMDRMDAAREGSVAVPDRFFNKGRAKIERGDYRFNVDQDRSREKVAS
ncbi:hypothetical protein, partial [Burkholderia ubonensis]